jgi:hypothetical protein
MDDVVKMMIGPEVGWGWAFPRYIKKWLIKELQNEG